MILIFNNTKYKLLFDQSCWLKDDWDYVLARKLIVTATNTEAVSIEQLLKIFSAFGKVKKIGIFQKEHEKFAHITFDQSHEAYLAFSWYYLNKLTECYEVAIAPIHQQPDNALAKFLAPILSLCDEILTDIFAKLNIHDQASILRTCERFRQIMKKKLLKKNQIIKSKTHYPLQGVITACQIMKNIKTNGYKVKISSVELKSNGLTILEFEILCTRLHRILEIDEIILNEYSDQFESVAEHIEILRLTLTNCHDGLKKNFRNVHTLILTGKSPFSGQSNYLENFNNLTTLCLVNMWWFDICNLREYLTESKTWRRLILRKMTFKNFSRFWSCFFEKNKIEKRTIEIIYDKINFKENIEDSNKKLEKIMELDSFNFIQSTTEKIDSDWLSN